jgi:ATP-binding cassette subfamily F protein 2
MGIFLCVVRNRRADRICRLLDKIAKQILVCENRTIRVWDGSISDYKNYLRKKMISAGAV